MDVQQTSGHSPAFALAVGAFSAIAFSRALQMKRLARDFLPFEVFPALAQRRDGIVGRHLKDAGRTRPCAYEAAAFCFGADATPQKTRTFGQMAHREF